MALTWRNVGGTNFGDSVAALGMGGRFLDRGLTGLSDALGRFSEWQTEQNDRAVLANAQTIQDPPAYREALRSGSILGSIDPTQVSARTLAAIDNRSRSLLDRAAAEYTYDRTRSNDAALDGNREFLAAMADAAQSGDPARVAAVRARFPGALASLPSEQILRIAGQTQGLEAGAVGLAGQRQSQAQSGERHGWARSDRADQEAGRRVANDLLAGSFSRDDAVRLLEENTSLTPGARAQAMALVTSEWGRFFPTADGTGSPVPGGRGAGGAQQGSPAGAALAGALGGSAGAPGTQAGSPYDVTYQYRATDRPITSMTLGDLQDHQASMVRTQGHSPVGAYQINQATLAEFAPRVLGENWRSQQFTPEVQDRIAEAIYNARRGGDLTGTWAALRGARVPGSTTSASEAGAYQNVPWAVARQQIMSGEIGAAVRRADATRAQGTNLAQDIAARRAQETANTPIPGWEAARTSTESVDQVAARLVQSMPGTDHNDILYALSEIMRYGQEAAPDGARSPITPAIAGAILAQNQGASRTWLRGIYAGVRTRDNQWSGIRSQIDSVARGDVERSWRVDQTAAADQQGLASQVLALQQAQAQLRALEEAALVRQSLLPRVEEYRAAVARQEIKLQEAISSRRTRLGWEAANRPRWAGTPLAAASPAPVVVARDRPVANSTAQGRGAAALANQDNLSLPGLRPRPLTDIQPGSVPRLPLF